MEYLEIVLLLYYRSRPLHALTTQEIDEYLYLEAKHGIEKWQAQGILAK